MMKIGLFVIAIVIGLVGCTKSKEEIVEEARQKQQHSQQQAVYENARNFWAKFPPEAEQAAFECSQLATVSQEYQKKQYGTPNTSHEEVYQTCMKNKGYGYVIEAK